MGYNESMDTFKDQVVPAGMVKFDLYNTITKKHGIWYQKNLFVTAGKNSIASALIGTSNKGIITYCATGTGNTAPAPGNTGLVTELFRKLISVRSVSGNVATFQTFFTTSESIGTLNEFGLFGDDASATPGSGTLYCRTLATRVKSPADTLTLSWAVTIG